MTDFVFTETKDPSVLQRYLDKPGFARRVLLGHKLDGAALLALPGARYYVASDGHEQGLVSVVSHPSSSISGEIHVCLRTKGARTRRLVRGFIALLRSEGYRLLTATYPASNRGADRLAEDLGFAVDDDLRKMLYPSLDNSFRTRYLLL